MTETTPPAHPANEERPQNAELHPNAELHQRRQMAESFGVDTERYDRTRPAYPDALIEQILAATPGRDVLDVGCGTGILARQMRAAGCTVLGVEPDERMAAFARSTGVDVEPARFEEWDPAGRTFDVVAAGTAWHWIDPVAGAAAAARALRPGGRLAALWHTFTVPDPVMEAFGAVVRRVVPDSPFNFQAARQGSDAYQPVLDRMADGMRAAGAFGPVEQWRHEWEKQYTRDEWLDQLPTSGALTRVPADHLAEILDEVGAAVDAMGGGFPMPYVTLTVTAAKL
jgi:SAM-dependent methyltransferase